MKIEFCESGGIAGVTRRCEIDIQALSAAEREEIEELIRSAGVLRTKFLSITPGACDVLGYSLSVKSEDLNYRVKFSDLTVPKEARALLNHLKTRARAEAS